MMTGRSMRRPGLVLGLVFMMVLGARLAGAQPTVDREALLRHVQRLADDRLEGRATGTGGGRAARDYVRDAFRQIGLQPFGDFVHPFRFTDREGRDLQGYNVMGFVPGTQRNDLYMVVTAHYDHLGLRDGVVYNGADDNASGVAVLLAAAAYFKAHPPRHPIVFVALDAEERGLRGARAFFDDPPIDPGRIALNVNLDMVSRSDRNELFASGTYHYPFLTPLLEPVRARSSVHLRFGHDRPEDGHDDWTMASDHGVFHQHGIPYLYFGVEDHPDYHRPTDDFEAIPQDFFVRSATTILDALITLDAHLEAIRAGAQRKD